MVHTVPNKMNKRVGEPLDYCLVQLSLSTLSQQPDLFPELTGEVSHEAPELAERIKNGNHIHLIDVREPHELEISHIDGAQLIPLGQLASRLSELDSAEEMVLFCKAGTRSARALELMVSAGFRKVKNLKGGINAWAREVDPSQPIY